MKVTDARHLPAAGHMLPLSHAKLINPEIARHIARADDLAEVSLACDLATARDLTGNRKLQPVRK